jgi:hypothetical protein
MPLNAADYIRPPRTNVVKALGLALALLRRAPKDAPEPARKATKRLRAATTELQRRRRVRQQPTAKRADPREAKAALDTTWGALRDGLLAAARLPREHSAASVEAQALLDRVFPGSLTFLQQEYNAVWVESDELLRTLREEDVAAAIGRVIHADFGAAVERAHKDFGDVIGMTAEVAPTAAGVDLAEALTALNAAIASYAVQMVAAADDADAATEASVRHALEPIVAQRARGRKRTEDATTEEEGEGDADADAPANDADAEPAEDTARVA